MTKADHPSGTDRIAEVSHQFPDHEVIINVQGDEPLISPELIDQLAKTLLDDPELEMVTAANPLPSDSELFDDSNVVKVVISSSGRALYFSRSPIPFQRTKPVGLKVYRHKGIYGFHKKFLHQYIRWAPTSLEQCEGLEQLRALENDARIKVITTDDESPGVDTPEQAKQVARELGD